MSQQGWPRNPRSGQQDDWWSQLYDPGSPDTGSSRSGDTLDDRYASVRRTMGPSTSPGKASGPRGAPDAPGNGTARRPDPQTGREPEQPGPEADNEPDARRGEGARPDAGTEPHADNEPDADPDAGTEPDAGREEDADPGAGRVAGRGEETARNADRERDAGREEDAGPGREGARGPGWGADPRSQPSEEPPPDPCADKTFAQQSFPSPQPPPEPSARPLPDAQPSAPATDLTSAPSDAVGGSGARTAGAYADDAGQQPDAGAPAASGASVESGGVPLRPDHVGDRPPTYEPEPGTFPAADASSLSELVPDTVLDGAHYGGLTLRAASLRGDSARHRGVLRRDALLTARFGSGESALLLVAVAAGGRAASGGHRAAREICHSIGSVIGRSHVRLAEDIRAGRRGALKSGLQRLTERCYGKLRAQAAALEMRPEEYTADLRCLLLSADPRCRTRVFFGTGAGGLFRLRSGEWQDLELDPAARGPHSGGLPGPGPDAGDTGDDAGEAADAGTDPAVNALDPSELGDPAALSVPVGRAESRGPREAPTDREPPGRRQPDETVQFGRYGRSRPPRTGAAAPAPPAAAAPAAPAAPIGPSAGGEPSLPPVPPPVRPEPDRFRFCAAVARSGDTLLLCSPGLAEPLRAEPAFARRLARSWAWSSERTEPPGLAAFLADVQPRIRGYADDRTAVAVWEN